MDLILSRPGGIDDANWSSIEEGLGRLQRASLTPDWALMIDSAKELAEAVARVVLEARGETAASRADLPKLLSRAQDLKIHPHFSQSSATRLDLPGGRTGS